MKQKVLEILENTWNKIKKWLEITSFKIGGYFIYAFIIYFFYSLYHFYPHLFSYENISLYFIIYFIIFIFYKKFFFNDFLKSYLETLKLTFFILRIIFPYIIFFGILVFYIWWQDIQVLTGSVVLFYISILFNLFYDKNDKYLEMIKKYNYTKKSFFIMIICINILLILFFRKWLIINNSSFISIIIIPLLLIFNGTLYYIYTNFFADYISKSKLLLNKRKISEKFISRRRNKSRLRLNNTFYLWFLTIILSFYLILNNYQAIWKIVYFFHTPPLSSETNNTPTNNKLSTNVLLWNTSNTGAMVSPWETTSSGNLSFSWAVNEVKEVKSKIKDTYTFPRYVWLWDSGRDIRQLQQILKSEWYYPWTINGTFDTALWEAISTFIKAKTWTTYSYRQLWPQAMEIFKNIEIGKKE